MCLTTMAYVYTACTVRVTIFSTGGKVRPVSSFTELYTLTQATRSYALLLNPSYCWPDDDWSIQLKRPHKFLTLSTLYYHMSNSRECTGVNGEVLLHTVYKKLYFILQVMRS